MKKYCLCLCLTAAHFVCEAKTLEFSGETWVVKSGVAGPGPNNWSEDNAWVDGNGYLHLKLSYENGQWYSAEVYQETAKASGYYQWQVQGELSAFDPNVVLGLFNYAGPDGQNEIDIEMAKWGYADAPLANFTIWPASANLAPVTRTTDIKPSGTDTIQRFFWSSNQVCFQLFNDIGDGVGIASEALAAYQYVPKAYKKAIPQRALPVHLNLWLRQGLAPLNGQEVEVVLKSFRYIAQGNADTGTNWCQ